MQIICLMFPEIKTMMLFAEHQRIPRTSESLAIGNDSEINAVWDIQRWNTFQIVDVCLHYPVSPDGTLLKYDVLIGRWLLTKNTEYLQRNLLLRNVFTSFVIFSGNACWKFNDAEIWDFKNFFSAILQTIISTKLQLFTERMLQDQRYYNRQAGSLRWLTGIQA